MQTIETAGGAKLRVDLRADSEKIMCVLEHEQAGACVLHWGLLRGERAGWKVPNRSAWPEGSKPVTGAVQTPFALADGNARLTLQIDPAWGYSFLEFALFHPTGNRWDNNRGRNYRVALPVTAQPAQPPLPAARALISEPRNEVVHALDEGCELAMVTTTSAQSTDVAIATDLEGPLVLHWGVAGSRRGQWSHPVPATWPSGTAAFDAHAVRTPFVDKDGLRQLRLSLPAGEQPVLCFVLYQPDQERWLKNRGGNFTLALAGQKTGPLQDPGLAEIAAEIIEKEAGDNSWTLMHRFELAFNVLDRIGADNLQGLALVFVWLRFSAIRQLDWQRRFNTKPRELAHAQDRLTNKIAERYASADASARPLLRLIATTVGRGGEGQRVRDGILEIMHRNHIKEVAGHFLEEWHQKLHNNTTPDDVVIAEAYIAFLRANGDRGAFYAALKHGGVTRERLLSYERPIRSEPDFVPHLRDPLLRDFDEFLGVLRAVHRATDLGTSIAAARAHMDAGTQHLLDEVRRRHHEPGADTWLLQSVTQVRTTVQAQLHPGRPGLREWLYLDLALEDFLRSVVERNLQRDLPLAELRTWTELALRNLMLSRPHGDLELGLRHLQRLWSESHEDKEAALHGQAVLERLRRALATIVDGDFRLLQPLADHLGLEMGAADWSVRLFTEEVVRGRLEFVASALSRKLDALLRTSAGLGKWQVISRGHGQTGGKIDRQASLAAVQGHAYSTPTVLIVDEIRGDEDVPQGATAILGRSTVDLVSHLAVRARNTGVLLATCWDDEALASWKAGEWAHLRITPAGEIVLEKGQPETASAPVVRASRSLVPRPAPGPWVLTSPGFRNDLVGAKTLNLQRLVGRLPDWIHLPASIALPFGVCERTWEDSGNRALLDEHRALEARIANLAPEAVPEVLSSLRALTTRLLPPAGFEPALRAAMADAGLPKPEPWQDIWQTITRVWASKWNDRAFFNRRSNGIADHQLLMAVLIQQVVPADYAFVIHTANPTTGDRDDLYAEMVPGLGETLVGNHPGRALGFAMRRNESTPRIVSYPSKSAGLYGQGLFFRSDSNGEDLAGFAGAGLYDSFMVPGAEPRPLDLANDSLLWNNDLRHRILTCVAKLGFEVERVLGFPQDIEGVYTQGRFVVVQTRPQVGLTDA
jgi:alpha-glucan,water dikinase